MNCRLSAILALVMAFAFGGSIRAEDFDWDIWRSMVALDGGRTKPFDTFAWEQIYSFAGKSKWKPTAYLTFGISDVKDWEQLQKAINAESNDFTREINARLKDEQSSNKAQVGWDTSELEREAFAVDGELNERLEEFVTKVGIAKSMKEFRREATLEADRALFERWDKLIQSIDEVNAIKTRMLQAMNEVLAERSHATGDSAAAGGIEQAIQVRRAMESALADGVTPLADRQADPAAVGFEDRKYDPVELAVTLILTWDGWDKREEIQALMEQGERATVSFDRIYREFHSPDVWDSTPIIDARYQELAPKLMPETMTAVSIRTVQDNPWFIRWALRAAEMKEDKSKKSDMSTADEKAVDVLQAYRAFLLFRSGQTLFLGPDQQLASRVSAITESTNNLAETIRGKSASEAIPLIAAWKNDWPESVRGMAGEDLTQIADRLGKELDVQVSSKSGPAPAVLLEQQTRLRTEELLNEIRWLRLIDVLCAPKECARLGYGESDVTMLRDSLMSARTALLAGDAGQFNQASRALAERLQTLGKSSAIYPDPSQIATELHYNKFQPFLWTAVFSGISLVVLTLSLGVSASLPYALGLASLLVAIGTMIYGMVLRISISGRPPVTNMYETIIWASFVMAILAVILGFIYRHRIIATTAALTLTPATLLAYVMPPEYGSSIAPLVPVLRDNFWLIIHVLTIVASYGAFMLAWMLGNVGLAYYLTGNERSTAIKPLAVFIYRAVQVGVLLLAAGTILGGWWAAYSWGRFWGWDPKEVWALIALLGYLAVLHARLAGLIKTFGLIVSSVLAFSGVVMSWYGVNFVLGEGLHAYAFGSGGQPVVFSVVAANIVYVIGVIVVHRARKLGRKDVSVSQPKDVAEPAPIGS